MVPRTPTRPAARWEVTRSSWIRPAAAPASAWRAPDRAQPHPGRPPARRERAGPCADQSSGILARHVSSAGSPATSAQCSRPFGVIAPG